MPIWNPQVECAPVADRRALQLARLQDTVARLYARVPFYRDKLAAAKLRPEDVRSLADLARLPFTLSWWAYSFPLAALIGASVWNLITWWFAGS